VWNGSTELATHHFFFQYKRSPMLKLNMYPCHLDTIVSSAASAASCRLYAKIL
jgi:hypothetical protein